LVPAAFKEEDAATWDAIAGIDREAVGSPCELFRAGCDTAITESSWDQSRGFAEAGTSDGATEPILMAVLIFCLSSELYEVLRISVVGALHRDTDRSVFHPPIEVNETDLSSDSICGVTHPH
jgi:hypothetical protein